MPDTIPARCKPTWANGTFNTRCATPNWRQRGLRAFGGIDPFGGRLCEKPAPVNTFAFGQVWTRPRRLELGSELV
jgi:hypothetical protein